MWSTLWREAEALINTELRTTPMNMGRWLGTKELLTKFIRQLLGAGPLYPLAVSRVTRLTLLALCPDLPHMRTMHIQVLHNVYGGEKEWNGTACVPVPEKCHQSKEFGGGRSCSWASHLTAFDLQLGSSSALLQTAKRPGHRAWAAWSNCLIGPSVSYMEEVGVDVAESHTDLFPR